MRSFHLIKRFSDIAYRFHYDQIFSFNFNVKSHMLNYLKIIAVLHTQMGYILDSNTLKTDWLINSAASLVYFDIDHRIPLLILSTFNSMILILCSREENIEYICFHATLSIRSTLSSPPTLCPRVCSLCLCFRCFPACMLESGWRKVNPLGLLVTIGIFLKLKNNKYLLLLFIARL